MEIIEPALKTVLPKARETAFSLIELLVVIGVIGLVAAIAIPVTGRINDAAKDTKNRRNAQQLASVFAAAQAAGLNFYVVGDETATIKAIVKGGAVTKEGPFKDTFFGIPSLNDEDQVSAASYLEMNDGNSMLVFKTE